MASSPESLAVDQAPAVRPWTERAARWNRRLHYYLGLYLLLFVWLFAFTGLLLNHSQWKFAEFWTNRREDTRERDIVAPRVEGDLARARDLMRQLEIAGEIEWTASGDTPGALVFRASRPGQIFDIKADLARQTAEIKRIEFNAWGILRVLHTFTGVRPGDARNSRDWILTSLWAWAMDAVAVGLILMVLSSLYLWYERTSRRTPGLLALGLGSLSCGLFVCGLAWIY